MHREIYRAIRSHNPPQARQAMEQHLNLARMAQATEDEGSEAAANSPTPPSAATRP